jgi:translation initiation factor 1
MTFKVSDPIVRVRIQQRDGRRCITVIYNIGEEFDHFKIIKVMKRKFLVNGGVLEDEDVGCVIQLAGDVRMKVKSFLLENGICGEDKLRVCGVF